MVEAVSRARVWTPTEVDVLEAVKSCCERWGAEKVTADDIAQESGVSRATLYRIFPGGKDVIFEALRVYELDHLFAVLSIKIEGAATLEDLLVRAVTCATVELRNDQHLAIMLASEPGAVVSELTVDGLPRIARVASAYLVPFVDRFLPPEQSRSLIDLVVRLVISYFLAPAEFVDLGDEASARSFLAPFVPPELSSNSQLIH
jgi:AcrR family transcriptional regulator